MMKTTTVKRLFLGAVVALGLAGVALTTMPAGQAHATERKNCVPVHSDNMCVPQ